MTLIDNSLLREALEMIADPDLKDRTFEEVEAHLHLDVNDTADGENYCSVVYSNWIFATLARMILADDAAGLRAFIDKVRPPKRHRS